MSGVDWTVRVWPEGHGRWAFVAGTFSGHGFKTKKEAQEEGERNAALRQSAWRPMSEAPPKGEVLLYWPAISGENSHTPMMRVDFAGSTPFRPPSHWMPKPPHPAGEVICNR